VDATINKAIAKDVKGFPTIKFYVDGEPMEYNGGRTGDAIVAWLKKKTGPPATSITTEAEVNLRLNSISFWAQDVKRTMPPHHHWHKLLLCHNCLVMI
jgi:hypothetical protein